MKTKISPQNLPSINPSWRECRRIPLALVSVIILMLLALSGKAGNILRDPGFETAPFANGWSQNASVTWSQNAGKSQTPYALVHSGANSLWMQGIYNSGPNLQWAGQDFSTTPGSTYTADAWYSAYVYQTASIGGSGANGTGLFQNDASGNEDGWVEVLFKDSGGHLLADYKSTIIDPNFCINASNTLAWVTDSVGAYLPWEDFQVTNQYDVSTITLNAAVDPDSDAVGITNTLGPGGVMTAPAGAVTVEFRISMFQALYEPGAPFWDDATLDQLSGASPSVIGNVSPDGSQFFNTNTAFSFTVTSAATGGAGLPNNPTSGIGVVVNGQTESGSLQFSGPSTNLSVTLPGAFTSNTVYTVSVSVTNSGGLTSASSYYFDTFPTNTFVVFAEDYDFTNGGFIENPIPTAAPAANSYYDTAGVLASDLDTYNGTGTLPGNGASQIIRSDGYSAIQTASDIQFPIYAAQNNASVYNVQIAYNNDGNWFNYSRIYPAGNYLLYMRYNNNAAGNLETVRLVTGGIGTTTQTTTNLGVFVGANTGAGYAWTPLTDPYGNDVIVSLPAGTTNTLQLLSGNGAGAGDMENFVAFAFVPAGTVFPPVINNLVPNNVSGNFNNIFLSVPTISYSVSSAFSTVAQSNIHTLINGVDVSSSVSYSGNNTNWSASLPCPQNQINTLVITAQDANGLSNRVSETFDSFTQSNLMIEALDFDFNGGQFIDNPIPTAGLSSPLATDSYYDGGIYTTNVAVTNIDNYGNADTQIGGGEAWAYRQLDTEEGQEITADFLRDKFINAGGVGINAQDYDMGYWNGGYWENYTRTFPASYYHVYSRMAGGAGPFSGTSLGLVTSGRGTTTQTTNTLGTFADANAAGWAIWHWVPMMANGSLATIKLGGVQTLKFTSGNNLNVHYLMFVPTGPPILTEKTSGSNIGLSFVSQPGHTYTFLYSTSLSGPWQTLSGGIAGDGTVKTASDAVTGKARFYSVQMQ